MRPGLRRTSTPAALLSPSNPNGSSQIVEPVLPEEGESPVLVGGGVGLGAAVCAGVGADTVTTP